METAELISKLIGAISFLTPLFVVIWRLAKADNEVKNNTKQIQELKMLVDNIDQATDKCSFHNEKLENLEKEITEQKTTSEYIEKTLNILQQKFAGIETKLDLLLQINKINIGDTK